MYRKIMDFLTDWQYEQEMTLNMMERINDEQMSQKISPEVRTLGRLAWRITQTLTEMTARAGLLSNDALEKIEMPDHIAEIRSLYQKHAIEVAQMVKAHWTDADLEIVVDMYGEQWVRGKVLLTLVLHQAHHRAQMTILMRLLGIQVPGVYGPAKEEWVQYGMHPMK